MKKQTIVVGNSVASRFKDIMHLMMGYNAHAISGLELLSAPKSIRRFFTQDIIKPRPRILECLRITSGGRHAWLDSDKGVIRKPLWEVSPELILACRERR